MAEGLKIEVFKDDQWFVRIARDGEVESEGWYGDLTWPPEKALDAAMLDWKAQLRAARPKMSEEILEKIKQEIAHPPISGPRKATVSVWASWLEEMPCPACGQKQNYFEAVTNPNFNPLDNSTYATERPHHECIQCGMALRHVVPLMAFPHPWVWGRRDG